MLQKLHTLLPLALYLAGSICFIAGSVIAFWRAWTEYVPPPDAL
jgi:hypothetical protein